MTIPFESVPGVGAPARRALAAAGYEDLASLDGVDYATLASMHGVGTRSLERLQAALEQRHMSLGGHVPASDKRWPTYVEGHTGETAADIKTHETDVNPEAFIDSLDTDRRVAHGRWLLELFNRITGEKPVMWGPSMVGYGQVHYRYATGRQGDTFKVGFSPRKAKLSLYGLTDGPEAAKLLAKLGKHAVGASCLYVNKPEDVDETVLAELIELAWKSPPGAC